MTSLAPVRVGDVVHVAEKDYFYGLGCLTLRITSVHGLMYLDSEPWVVVDGIPLWPNGHEGVERYAQIRVAGFRYLPDRPPPRNPS